MDESGERRPCLPGFSAWSWGEGVRWVGGAGGGVLDVLSVLKSLEDEP